ncbi:MAG: hypothetical protein ABIV50_01480 [Opitutus sp.]
MSGDLPSNVISEIAFIQRSGGTVKTLGGFKKSHHTLPDAANATTNAFLGKICADELASEAEALFQAVRTGLGYKRKDVSLSVASPAAVLTAKDFVVEFQYALEESEPTRYSVTTTLRALRNLDLARTAEFSAIFAGRFTEISFALRKGARVEAVVDAIESSEETGLAVTYPSDCRDCEISVEGVDAVVRCTTSSLEIVFPSGGAPADLIAGFAAIREAFAISKVLSGLIG